MLQNHNSTHPDVYRYFFEHHPDGLGIVDSDGLFRKVNASLLDMFGYTQEEMLGQSLDQLWNGPCGSRSGSRGNVQDQTEWAVLHKKGYLVYVRLTCTPYVSGGEEIGRIVAFEPLARQRQHRKELSDVQDMFAFISEKSQNIISSFTADGVFSYVSPTVKALLGYSPEEVIGQPGAIFNHPDDNDKLCRYRNSTYIDRDTVRFTGRVRHKNGEYRWYETTAEYIRDEHGQIIQTIGVGRDITDRKEAEETIAHLAYHDSLTELPNRRLFKDDVSRLLEEPGALHGLMLLDLDGFKYVNDTFGHDIGDRLLTQAARRLMDAAGDQGIVARWGGDEFTVFRAHIESKADIDSLMKRIKEAIAEPFLIAGRSLSIAASIGVSYYPEDGDEVEALIRHADAAMYRAKNQARDRV